MKQTDSKSPLFPLPCLATKAKPRTRSFALPEPYNLRREGYREADLLRAVLAVLGASGAWHRRIEVQGVMTRAPGREDFLRPSRMQGLPDVVALKEGKMWGIEVKAPGGRVTEAQARTLRELGAAGGIGIVVVEPQILARVLRAPERLGGLPTCQGIPVA